MKRDHSSDSCEHGLSLCSKPRGVPLGAIRRKLWILSARLQSLPAKIESMYRQSVEAVYVGGLKQCTHERVGTR